MRLCDSGRFQLWRAPAREKGSKQMGKRWKCVSVGAAIVALASNQVASRSLAALDWSLLQPETSSSTSDSTNVVTDARDQQNQYAQNSQCPFTITDGFVEEFQGRQLDPQLWCAALIGADSDSQSYFSLGSCVIGRTVIGRTAALPFRWLLFSSYFHLATFAWPQVHGDQ